MNEQSLEIFILDILNSSAESTSSFFSTGAVLFTMGFSTKKLRGNGTFFQELKGPCGLLLLAVVIVLFQFHFLPDMTELCRVFNSRNLSRYVLTLTPPPQLNFSSWLLQSKQTQFLVRA